MKTKPRRTSLAVQWLRLDASNAGGLDSILGLGTRIPRAMGCGQKKKTNKKEREITESKATEMHNNELLLFKK